MDIKALLIVSLRLIGCYLIWVAAREGLIRGTQVIQGYVHMDEIGFIAKLVAVSSGVFLLAAFILIRFAKGIAELLLRSVEILPEKKNDQFESQKMQSFIFIVFGIYILSWAIPDFVYNGLWLLRELFSESGSSLDQTTFIISEITTLVEIAIGAYLVFGVKGLSRILWKIRGA